MIMIHQLSQNPNKTPSLNLLNQLHKGSKRKKRAACKCVTLWNILILPTGYHGLIDILQCHSPLGTGMDKGVEFFLSLTALKRYI